ncbi:hypothetical protein NKW43_14035 [Gluconobacter albidus]|uniref:hypothetical protein n=1 Tax=Gluconobacter albidus TaxID=318683 RepID=UPI0020A16FDF|nr:hypothetical protein [Gluconobacter albidus]MCP1274787.1 hypothetical protein [Gluconobacter albidus]
MSNVTVLNAPLPTISCALSAALDAKGAPSRFGPVETSEERIARMRRGDPAPGMVIRAAIPSPSPAVVEEAKRILPQLEMAVLPADRNTVMRAAERMLLKLNGSVANPFGVDAARARACLLAEAAQDLPAGVWDEATDRKLLRTCRFMPSVAELIGALEAEIQPLRDKIARVRLVSQFERKPVDRAERPAPDEIERRKAALAELQAAAEAQAKEDREIRDFGMWMPAGAEGKTGLELAEILRSHLAALDGPKLRITQERIEALERNAAILAQLATFETAENRA